MANISILKASTVVNPDSTYYVPLAKVADKGAWKANLPLPADTEPLMAADAASAGTSMTWARADHVHPANVAMQAEIKSYVDVQDSALQKQISALASNLRFIGQADVVADSVKFTLGSEITPNPGPLPAPSQAYVGFYVIITAAGRPPAGSNIPADDYALHDWLVCDGTVWERLDVGSTAATASTTAVVPEIDGMDTVQEVLEHLYDTMPLAAVTVPITDGLGSVGSGTKWARDDHVHPTDVTRYATSNPAGYVDPAGAAAAAPVQSVATKTGAVTLTHSDITDWTATLSAYYPASNPAGYQTAAQVTTTLGPYALASSVPIASSTAPVMNGTAAAGTGTTWARADHIHPVDTSRYAASNPSGFQTAAQVTAVLPVAATAAPPMNGTAAVGTGTTWARADHVHPVDVSRAPIKGVTDGSDATAGNVGEYFGVQRLSTNSLNLLSASDTSLATVDLGPGDWDVWGSVGFTISGNNTTTLKAWINLTGGPSAPSVDQMGGYSVMPVGNNITQMIMPVTPSRVSLTTTTTMKLGATSVSSGGTISGWGKLMARRMR